MFKEKKFVCQASMKNGAGQDEWRGFVRGNACGVAPGDEPLTLTRCLSYMKPLGRSPVCGRAYNLQGKIFLFYCSSFHGMMVYYILLPVFDDTGYPGYPHRREVYRPSFSTLMSTSRFLTRNSEAELKFPTFSSLLLFKAYIHI